MLVAGALSAATGYLSEMWAARGIVYDNEIARCKNGDTDCAQKDLPAQVRAAAASEAMVDLAVWQTLLSALGVAGLLYSLYLTRTAVRAATDAAEDAEAGLAMAREHMTNDLRAWVLPERVVHKQATNVTMDDTRYDEAILFAATFTNAGRTPALRFVVHIQMVLTGINDPRPAFADYIFPDDGSGSIVAPGQTLQSYQLVLGGQQRSDFLENRLAIWILARVIYNSVFDEELKHTEVCRRVIRNGTVDIDGIPEPYFEIGLSGIQVAT